MARSDMQRFYVLEFEEIGDRRDCSGSLYVTDASDAGDAIENVIAEIGGLYALEARQIDRGLPSGYIAREARFIAHRNQPIS